MARSLEEIQAEIDLVQKEKDAIEKRIKEAGIYSPEEIAQMYSLDPKAAEFFANKQINEDRAASMALRAANAGKNKEATLEQKTRLVQTAQNREKANYDKAVADFGINSPQAQRAKKAFDELTIELGSTDPSVNNAYARAGQIVPRDAELDEVESIREDIKNAEFDEFGVLKDKDTIINRIEDWRLRNQIPVTDPTYKGLIELLKAKEAGSITTEKGKQDAEKEAQRKKELEEKKIADWDKDYKAMYDYADRDLSSRGAKRRLLTLVLRNQTGAAIAADEAKNLVADLITDNTKRYNFIYDWDQAILNAVKKEAASTGGKIDLLLKSYLNLPWDQISGLGAKLEMAYNDVDENELKRYALAPIPQGYLDYRKERANAEEEKANPNKGDY